MELWLTVNGKRTCASAPLSPSRACAHVLAALSLRRLWMNAS